jgi:hypothetical protein
MGLFRSSGHERWESNWRRVQTLSLREARDQAMTLLSDPNAFETLYAKSDPEKFKEWSPELAALLSTYELVACRIGDARISWSEIRPLPVLTGFTEIGHNENAKVAVRQGEDRIFEFDGEGNLARWLAAPLPSPWHWISWTYFVCQVDAGGPLMDR